MSELHEFRRAVLETKQHYADISGDISQARKIGKEIDKLEYAHSTLMLKEVGGLIVRHFMEKQTPKSTLLVRTINNLKPNRVRTVATGWLLHVAESAQLGLESEATTYTGYLLNQSSSLFRFENGEMLVEDKKNSYRVSRYGQEALPGKDLESQYPDFEDDIIGKLEKLEYSHAHWHGPIESLFVETVINQNIKI